ncbi:hypothetical protein Tco_0703488 [Tanacetum coccineum]|uniref:Tf2-1-like SH3-like domain-containing protein n=1 Tax=Tanacetum coccineum TaxID=301880 RepID=A0ABQ4Y0V6_9ASTR
MQETTNKVVMIRDWLKAARDRQKSYADNRRKPLEFQVGDHVMLKVSPWKGVVRLGKKGKLAPRFVGPFDIPERGDTVATRFLAGFPVNNDVIHRLFHEADMRLDLSDAVPSFDNAVLFRCSRSGSLMFNAFFFEISMECLIQELCASVSTDTNNLSLKIALNHREKKSNNNTIVLYNLQKGEELEGDGTLDKFDPKEFDIFKKLVILETMSIVGLILVDTFSFPPDFRQSISFGPMCFLCPFNSPDGHF